MPIIRISVKLHFTNKNNQETIERFIMIKSKLDFSLPQLKSRLSVCLSRLYHTISAWIDIKFAGMKSLSLQKGSKHCHSPLYRQFLLRNFNNIPAKPQLMQAQLIVCTTFLAEVDYRLGL